MQFPFTVMFIDIYFKILNKKIKSNIKNTTFDTVSYSKSSIDADAKSRFFTW